MRFHTLFLLTVAYAGLILTLRAWDKRSRTWALAGAIIMGVGVIPLAVQAGYRAWENSFLKIDERGVDLRQYQPFAPGTLLAALDHPAALRFTAQDRLPALDGATALYPLYAAFAQAVYPEDIGFDPYRNTPVKCSSTPNAYRNLIHKAAEVIFCARPSQRQIDEARDMGLEFEMTPVGRDAFVFFVHAGNPVAGLTTEQVRSIYAGRIVNWREVGGPDQTIRAFQRDKDSGSQTMLETIMDGLRPTEPPKEDRIQGMGRIIRAAAAYRNFPGALGFSFRYYLTRMAADDRIKLLEIDGVAPTPETIADGSYPFANDFYAITVGERSENTRKLIDWILSDEGRELVAKTGYIPIARP